MLFVEILFGVQTITFRCISIVEMQSRHTPTHFFSLQQIAPFDFTPGSRKRSFSRSCEKLLAENDTSRDTHSQYCANDYASENDGFHLFQPDSLARKTATCSYENLWRRAKISTTNFLPIQYPGSRIYYLQCFRIYTSSQYTEPPS
jgi:hypothetical protein